MENRKRKFVQFEDVQLKDVKLESAQLEDVKLESAQLKLAQAQLEADQKQLHSSHIGFALAIEQFQQEEYELQEAKAKFRQDVKQFQQEEYELQEAKAKFRQDVKQFREDKDRFCQNVRQFYFDKDRFYQKRHNIKEQLDELHFAKIENVQLKKQNDEIVDELISSDDKLATAKELSTNIILHSISFVAGHFSLSTSVLKACATAFLNTHGAQKFFDKCNKPADAYAITMAKTKYCSNCHRNSHCCARGNVISNYCNRCFNYYVTPSIKILGDKIAADLIQRRLEAIGRFNPNY